MSIADAWSWLQKIKGQLGSESVFSCTHKPDLFYPNWNVRQR